MHLFRSKVCRQAVLLWRKQICSHRSVRITGLLSASLIFKNWELVMHLACNYPCSLTSSRKLTKLPPWTVELLNPQDEGLYRPSFLGGVRGPVYRVEYISNTCTCTITLYTMLHKSHKHHFLHLQYT